MKQENIIKINAIAKAMEELEYMDVHVSIKMTHNTLKITFTGYLPEKQVWESVRRVEEK